MGVHLIRDHLRYFGADSCDFRYAQGRDHGDLYERLVTFRTYIVAIMGAHSLCFHEFRACGDPKFFGEKDPISAPRVRRSDLHHVF